ARHDAADRLLDWYGKRRERGGAGDAEGRRIAQRADGPAPREDEQYRGRDRERRPNAIREHDRVRGANGVEKRKRRRVDPIERHRIAIDAWNDRGLRRGGAQVEEDRPDDKRGEDDSAHELSLRYGIGPVAEGRDQAEQGEPPQQPTLPRQRRE